MTLSALKNTPKRSATSIPSHYGRGAAVDILYQGGMACLNAAGNVVPAGSATGLSAVLGRIERTVDNSAGSAGDVDVEVLPGQFRWDNSGTSIVTADIGQLCYAVDDESVHISNAGGRSIAGTIINVDSDGVWVQTLFHAASLGGAGTGAAGATQSIHSVRYASTANIANLATFTVLQDGVTGVEGDRVLLKNQASADENGIYVLGTVAGTAPLTRALDADGADEVSPGMLVYVSEGTVNADDWYVLTTDETITVDTTNLTFVKMPSLADLASTATGDGAALVGIEDAAAAFDATDVEGALAELVAVSAGNGANIIGYEDAGTFTTAADVDAALDELYQHSISANKHVELPIGSFYLATGAPLAIFAGGASAVPGTEYNNSEALSIRWNNNGTHDQVISTFVVPWDADVSQDMTLTIHASKSGNTLADATTFIVTAFNQVVGALADADANFGGTTGAMTGDAAAKTVQEVTLTLGNADLPAVGNSITIGIDPTSATLGTDDVSIHSVVVKYTSLLRTS